MFYNHNEFSTIAQTRLFRLNSYIKKHLATVTSEEKSDLESIMGIDSMIPAFENVILAPHSLLDNKMMNDCLLAIDSDIHALYDETASLGAILELTKAKTLGNPIINLYSYKNINVTKNGITLAMNKNISIDYMSYYSYCNTKLYGITHTYPFAKLFNLTFGGGVIIQNLKFDPTTLNNISITSSKPLLIPFITTVIDGANMTTVIYTDNGHEIRQADVKYDLSKVIQSYKNITTDNLQIYYVVIPEHLYEYKKYDDVISILDDTSELYESEIFERSQISDKIFREILSKYEPLRVAYKYLMVDEPDEIIPNCYLSTPPQTKISLSNTEYTSIGGEFETYMIPWAKNYKNLRFYVEEYSSGPSSVIYYLNTGENKQEFLPVNKEYYTQYYYVTEVGQTTSFKIKLNWMPDIVNKRATIYFNGKRLNSLLFSYKKEINSLETNWYIVFSTILPNTFYGLFSIVYAVDPDIERIITQSSLSWYETEVKPIKNENQVTLKYDIYYDRSDVSSFDRDPVVWVNPPISYVKVNGKDATDVTNYFYTGQYPLNLFTDEYEFFVANKNVLVFNKNISDKNIEIEYKTCKSKLSIICELRSNSPIDVGISPTVKSIVMEYDENSQTNKRLTILGEQNVPSSVVKS